jgi:hypothetical protein
MGFLDIALRTIARGWYAHPLAGKTPITAHGKNDATLDPERIQAWGKASPKANVGISCGPSGLCVMDADTGLKDEADFIAWRDRNGLPITYTVRTGRRPGFAVQMYYLGSLKDGKFELDGVTGDIKSLGGLVLAAGSVHPDSGETYYELVDVPLAPVPAIVDQSRKNQNATGKKEWPQIIHDGEGREEFLVEYAGTLRRKGENEDTIFEMLQIVNANRIAPPKPEKDLRRISHSIGNKPLPAPEPTLAPIAGPKDPKDLPIVETEPAVRDTWNSRLDAPREDYIDLLADEMSKGTPLPFGYVRETLKMLSCGTARPAFAALV